MITQEVNTHCDKDDENLSAGSTVISDVNDDYITDCSEAKFTESSYKPEYNSINDFEVIWQLGEGTQGSVYLVEWKHTKTKFALKVCSKHKHKKHLDDIVNESEILAKIKHPFIVSYHAGFENEHYKSFLLEFCYGGDLFYHLRKIEKSKRKNFSEKTVKFYICAIIIALQNLHDNGIVFRDLKPENILIDSNGYPKLWDFGLSVPISKLQSTKKFNQRGSCEYLAPEIISRKSYGFSSDWWSLGILTYELLHGKTPFEDPNIFKQQRNILTQKVDLKDNLQNMNCKYLFTFWIY